MHVEINDFQKQLLSKGLEGLVSALPEKTPENPAVNAIHDLVRFEAKKLLDVLNGPGDLKPKNTFRESTQVYA